MAVYADILLPIPLKRNFTYSIPIEMQSKAIEGKRVAVQFGRQKIYTGIITKLHKDTQLTGSIKPILDVLDEEPILTRHQLPFWKWMAEYYLCCIGEVMAAALPSAFRLESETAIELNPYFDGDVSGLSKEALRLVEALMNHGRMSLKEVSDVTGLAKVVNLVRTLTEAGILRKVEEVTERYVPKTEVIYSLRAEYHSEEAISALMDTLNKRAYRQLEVMMLLVGVLKIPEGDWNQKVPVSAFARIKGHAAALVSLTDKNILQKDEREISRLAESEAGGFVKDILLTSFQQTALDEIHQSHSTKDVCLLHGVTGSGKTEIYIKLIQECIESGRQALYLLPEIALTTQIIERLRKYFGDAVGIYHSKYSNAERAEVWKEVLTFEKDKTASRFRVILGARSAIFLPFADLGLIIVDEEHDSSYKQLDPAPRYHARDSALFLARLHQAKVLMGSATPAIETYAHASARMYGLVTLKQRYTDVLMPEILIADIREEKRKKKMHSHFSSLLIENLTVALENKEQAIMFQNRRGFSLRLECDACQHMPFCRNCDVSLIYHKNQSQLRCHYCGYTEPVPVKCPECGSPKILMKGFGTEKVEEELQDMFKDARVHRMDLDTTRSKMAYQRIINEFENQQIQILVGTQMVTKGLDFDHVSTVGILNADNMLSFPDFRAAERSFQLMAQVSGRSGRKQKRGKVIIQTSQPYNTIIRQVIDNNYEEMFSDQMAERKQFLYPPFARLIQLRVKHRDARLTSDTASFIADNLRKVLGKRVLGPEYPMIARIRNEYIKHILIKVEREASVKEAKKMIETVLEALSVEPLFRRVKVQIDVDPY